MEEVGQFNQEFDGAQDYDFIFRCTEKARKIHHIPKVLYHWRCHQGSTASNPESKLYAFEAGARAIQAHFDRLGIGDGVHRKGGGLRKIPRALPDRRGEPLVSVIIPNKDHAGDLDICLKSLMEKATYRNLEYVIIENNSTDPETFAYYEKLKKEHPNVKVVTWEAGVQLLRHQQLRCEIRRRGVFPLPQQRHGDHRAGHHPGDAGATASGRMWGAVGARLLYQDDTIQHAGVVVGFGGIAGHTFIGLHKSENSYFHRAMCAQDYSAVTAACMMTKRQVF